MNTFWDDVDDLSDDAVLLYIWSWTNQKCGMAGLYKIPKRKLLEGRLSGERLDRALTELEEAGMLRYVDGVLWNCARVKRLSMVSDNIAKSIARDVAEVGDNRLASEFIERYGSHPKLDPHLSLIRPSAEPRLRSVEPKLGGSREGRPTLPGQGQGQGQGKGNIYDDQIQDLPA